ncbi:MAG: hypothetical protein ACRD2S_08970 [Terriglobales bacterium]
MPNEDEEVKPERKAGQRIPEGTRVLIIGFLIFATFAAWAFWLRRRHPIGNYDTLAQCLAVKQVKMYGLYWCTHCADQKRMFGSSFRYVPYIECGVKGSRQETPTCLQAKVKNFPTWDFSGVRREGVLSLKDIGVLSGCDGLPHF